MGESYEQDDDRLTRIVSYLDGELDEAEAAGVEQLLKEDPDSRAQAEKLSLTWSMLDELDEEVSASKQFTQDTMSTIVAETTKSPSRSRTGWTRRTLRLLAKYKVVPCFLAGVLGGALGLSRSANAPMPRGPAGEHRVNATLLKEFDLLRNYNLYTSVPSLTELESLEFPPVAAGPENEGVQR